MKILRTIVALVVTYSVLVQPVVASAQLRHGYRSYPISFAGALAVGGTVYVAPGTTDWSTAANNWTATPAPAGNSADFAWADPPIAGIPTPQYQTIYRGQSIFVTVLAFHQPTAAEYAAGDGPTVDHVDAAADGGAWAASFAPTPNPQIGDTGYVFELRANDFADGCHSARFRVVPRTGHPIVLQGEISSMSAPSVSIAGTTMTVSGTGQINGVGSIKNGNAGVGPGIAPGTFILSRGTATGEDGTYNVNISQTVSSTHASFSDQPGFMFCTNANSTLNDPTYYVNNVTGNDGNAGTSSLAPKATIFSARQAANGLSVAGNQEVGTICVQGSGMYPLGNDTSGHISQRWLSIAATGSYSRCDGVNPGTPSLDASGSGYDHNRLHLRGFATNAVWNNGTNYDNAAIWLDNMVQTGPANSTFGQRPSLGGVWCTESTFKYIENGGCTFNRNMTFDHIYSDAISMVTICANCTITFNTPVGVVTGNMTAGSPVISNITPAVADILFSANTTLGASQVGVAGAANISSCSARNVASVDSPSQITLNQNATSTVTGAIVSFPCEHSDFDQFNNTGFMQSLQILSNVNDASATNNTGDEGILIERTLLNWAIINTSINGGQFFLWQGGSNDDFCQLGGCSVSNFLMSGSSLAHGDNRDNTFWTGNNSIIDTTCSGLNMGAHANLVKRGGTC